MGSRTGTECKSLAYLFSCCVEDADIHTLGVFHGYGILCSKVPELIIWSGVWTILYKNYRLKETDSSETMGTGLLALNLLFRSQEVTQKWVSVIIITDGVWTEWSMFPPPLSFLSFSRPTNTCVQSKCSSAYSSSEIRLQEKSTCNHHYTKWHSNVERCRLTIVL